MPESSKRYCEIRRHDMQQLLAAAQAVVCCGSGRTAAPCPAADTPLPLVGSMSDRVNVMQCRRAQVRIVIPPDGENRYRPVVDTHAAFKPPVSGYLPEQPPESARWKI